MTIDTIQRVFDHAGLEFTKGEGVRKKLRDVMTYRGRQGFIAYMQDVYETVKSVGGEVCVSNVDESLFTIWLGNKNDQEYMAKMVVLNNFDFKVLVREGDTNFTSSGYATYRWIPKELFHSVPFYVYGDKLAFLIFEEDDVTVHVINNKEIAEAQRIQFNLTWDHIAMIPPKEKAA